MLLYSVSVTLQGILKGFLTDLTSCFLNGEVLGTIMLVGIRPVPELTPARSTIEFAATNFYNPLYCKIQWSNKKRALNNVSTFWAFTYYIASSIVLLQKKHVLVLGLESFFVLLHNKHVLVSGLKVCFSSWPL